MSDPWHLLRTGSGDPAWNMAFDEALLEFSATLAQPILRFYSWTIPAATFGYFQKHADIESWTPLRPLIRRPTGGGLVPHNRDWTYSLVFPPGHYWYELRAEESYRRAHEWISQAFAALHLETNLAPCCAKDLPGQCFVGAEKFDLLFQGSKIAGAAQRRNKFGLLIQGSVQSHPRHLSRDDWEKSMLAVGEKNFAIAWNEFKPPAPLESRVTELAFQKYSQTDYNLRR
jgi:lipoate-protein ligase A